MKATILLMMSSALLPAQPVTTIAGTGTVGFSGDGGPAVQAQVNNPYGLTVGPDGALYFCEIGNHRVRRLDLKSGVISTAAGSGRKGYAGDGGPAREAAMNEPYEVRFDAAGNMFVAEMQNHVVRRVDAKSRVVTTVAGTGTPGFSGDGGPAVAAQLRQPHSIAFDAEGGLLICDIGNHRIRRVDPKSGEIETWAGTGERKPTPDGAPLAGTPLNGPRAIAADPAGNLYLVLREATPSTASIRAPGVTSTLPAPERAGTPAMAVPRNWRASRARKASRGRRMAVFTSPIPRATPSAAWI